MVAMHKEKEAPRRLPLLGVWHLLPLPLMHNWQSISPISLINVQNISLYTC